MKKLLQSTLFILSITFLFSFHSHSQTGSCTTSNVVGVFGSINSLGSVIGESTLSEGTVTFKTDADFVVYGSLTIAQASTLRMESGSVLNVYGDVSLSGNVVMEAGSTINFYGEKWTNSSTASITESTGVFNANRGSINFLPRPAVPAGVVAANACVSGYSAGVYTQQIEGSDVVMDANIHIANPENVELVNSNTRLASQLIFDAVDAHLIVNDQQLIFTSRGSVVQNVAEESAYIVTNNAASCADAGKVVFLDVDTDRYIPIGRAENDYTPLNLRELTAGTATFKVKVMNYAEATALGVVIDEEEKGMDRIWNITTEGSGNPPAISLQHNNATNGTLFSNDIGEVVQWNGGTDWYDSVTFGVNSSVGTVSDSYIHERIFGVPVDCSESGSWFTKSFGLTPLPVDLTYFEAITNPCNVTLSWETAQEINNQEFIIERSSNGITFVPVAIVPGMGTTTEPTQYNYIDEAGSGEFYYRLTQRDFDGTEEVFNNIQYVSVNCSDDQTIIVPNPVVTDAMLNYTVRNTGELSVGIYSMNGQLIKYYELTANQGDRINQVLQLRGLAASVYIVAITDGSYIESHKIVKQ